MAKHKQGLLHARLLVLYLCVILPLVHGCLGPSLTRPSVFSQNLDSTPWSPKHMSLRRGEHIYIYHNYTSIPAHEHNHRFRTREVIPHYRQVIRSQVQYREPSAHAIKRGFVVNPLSGQSLQFGTVPPDVELRHISWKWFRANNDCPVIIYLCFRSAGGRRYLKPTVRAGIKLWREALGDKRGVDFAFIGGATRDVCFASPGVYAPGVDRRTVEIRHSPGQMSFTGAGFTWSTRPGAMVLRFDTLLPSTEPNFRERNAADMAHELGK